MDLELPLAATSVDLVLYEAGGRTLGSDAAEVLRVERRRPDVLAAQALGAPPGTARALIVRAAREGPAEVQVPIDRFLGLERASPAALRRLPPFARGLVDPCVVGFLLREGALVPLIDLGALAAALAGPAAPRGGPALPDRP